jgi:hypothetical protein
VPTLTDVPRAFPQTFQEYSRYALTETTAVTFTPPPPYNSVLPSVRQSTQTSLKCSVLNGVLNGAVNCYDRTASTVSGMTLTGETELLGYKLVQVPI